MPDEPRLRALLTWSLAAFHAGFLFVVLAALLFRGGALDGLLSALNTLAGLGLYAVFWLGTWWTTGRATQGLPWQALEAPSAPLRTLGRVVLWGAVNGLLLFAVVLALIAGSVLVTLLTGRGRPDDLAPFVLSIGAIGSVVAVVVGALAGLLFALIDSALLALAGWLVPAPRD